MGDLLLALLAGVGAGIMNAAVGAGTLITFPVLIALGLPPLAANVTSAVGVSPANMTGAWTYRSALRQPHMRIPIVTATVAMITGAMIGVPLLLVLPPEAFTAVIPWLIIAAGLLTLVQPWITRRLARRVEPIHPRAGILFIGVMLAGIYLSYFGAATGVITLSVLLYAGVSDLQDANAIKNFAGGIANLLAALIYLLVAPVDLSLAVSVAIGAALGGLIGGRIAQRLSPTLFRWLILLVALLAAVYVLASQGR